MQNARRRTAAVRRARRVLGTGWRTGWLAGSLAGWLAGCAAFQGVAPTNLEPLVPGATRDAVEKTLGAPRATDNGSGCGSTSTYAYDQGRPPASEITHTAVIHPLAPLVIGLVAHPFLVSAQEDVIVVDYGPNGRVIAYAPDDPADWPRLVHVNRLWYEDLTVAERARRLFEAGRAVNGGSAGWPCLCLAAHLGHAPAQAELARAYAAGRPPVASDPVAALAWAKIAARNGHDPAADPPDPAGRLSHQEVSQADGMAAAWVPDPASCRPPGAPAPGARPG